MSEIVTKKINRDEFLDCVMRRLMDGSSDNAISDTDAFAFSLFDVYEAMTAELLDLVSKGYRVSLTGFGSFYAPMHKGHPVQFGSKRDTVKDYRVFKFSASNVLNKHLREITE